MSICACNVNVPIIKVWHLGQPPHIECSFELASTDKSEKWSAGLLAFGSGMCVAKWERPRRQRYQRAASSWAPRLEIRRLCATSSGLWARRWPTLERGRASERGSQVDSSLPALALIASVALIALIGLRLVLGLMLGLKLGLPRNS